MKRVASQFSRGKLRGSIETLLTYFSKSCHLFNVLRVWCRNELWSMTSAYSPSPGLLQPPLLSLREVQKRALLKVLSLNSEEEAPPQQSSDLLPRPLTGDPVWKFLVFDKLGQDVISSVLRVSDLREAGVTVHMQLKADRLQMEDVPASTPPPSPTY